MRVKKLIMLGVAFALLGGSAAAETLKSTSYSIDESFIGPGGGYNSTSPNFQSRDAIGTTAVGGSSSANNQNIAGYVTPDSPSLTFTVNAATVNMGTPSVATAGTGTASFSVYNYTSWGYIITTSGSAPTYASHTLTPMSGAGSSPGTEQFGINVVRNANFFGPGLDLGADPAQVPSSTFSFGVAATGYNTGGSFKYNNGDTIASAPKSSGQTNFTVSYVANVATTTPAGHYGMVQTLICVGTY